MQPVQKTKIIPTIEHYELGDKVFYKKEGTDALWDGPAQVIGVTKNQKTIYLSHGRFTYSTSQSRLCKIPEDILKRIMPPNQIPVDPDSDDDDILDVEITIDDIVASRRFRRHFNVAALGAGGRRHSVC